MKNIVRVLLVLFLFIHFQQSGVSQKTFNERLSVGAGLGLDYSALGVKFNYELVKNLDVFMGIGVNLISLSTPTIGLEYDFNRYVDKKVKPFLSFSLAKDFTARLSAEFIDVFGETQYVRERRNFLSSRITSGVLIPLPKHKQINIKAGVSINYVNQNKIDAYIDDFNMKYNTNRSYGPRLITPSVGIKIDLMKYSN